MPVITLVLLGVLICCPFAYSQASSADTKTLQAILEEVRQLRQDLHATAATVQAAQILLHRIRTQADVVARVSQRLEEAHTRSDQLKSARAQTAERMKSTEEALQSTLDAATRKELEVALAASKNLLEQLANREQENEVKVAEHTSQLRLEQAKLDDLEAQLDRLQKKLENAASQTGTTR
jgi:chromosome segregation ATPase